MEHFFRYLKRFYNGQLIIDLKETPIRAKATFNLGCNWIEFYPDTCELLPHNMSNLLGQEVTLTCYVDTDHARDKVACCLVTGIILSLNNTPLV